jgi:hypothetical protein
MSICGAGVEEAPPLLDDGGLVVVAALDGGFIGAIAALEAGFEVATLEGGLDVEEDAGVSINITSVIMSHECTLLTSWRHIVAFLIGLYD